MNNIRNIPNDHPESVRLIKLEMWSLQQEPDFPLISHGELVFDPHGLDLNLTYISIKQTL